MNSPRFIRHRTGFTLIEVILVIVIAGILATVALRSAGLIGESARTEEAKDELERLAFATVGNPGLHNNGVRSDFGYVGDIGALPGNLDALRINPGLATWQGPYIDNRYVQDASGFKTDPWGSLYALNGIALISNGSGSPIVRKLAGSESELLGNSVAGIILDADGTPPGNTYADSLSVSLITPDGAGATTTRFRTPDDGGYFSFDSIPIGNHDLRIIYLPDNDTLWRFVSVTPGASLYGEYLLGANMWGAGGTGSGLEFVDGSDTLGSGHCNILSFGITNTSASPIAVTGVTLSWSSPTAYFRKINWNGAEVYNDPPLGTGEPAAFTSTQMLNPGTTAIITVDQFKEFPNGGGPQVSVEGVEFTMEFSDGSTITFTADTCE